MSQYKAYTVTVTNDDVTVTGSLTAFLTNVSPGDAFLVANEVVTYTVASIVDDVTITLTAPYQGDSQAGVAYRITRDFTPNYNLAELSKGDADWPAILTVETIRRLDSIIAGLEARIAILETP